MNLPLVGFAQQSNAKKVWNHDPGHSQLGFYVKHMGVSQVQGLFNDFSVVAELSKEDLSDLSIKLEAKTASINTNIKMRDEHLRTADFFEVEKYPNLTFESTSVVPNGDSFAKIYGYLTLKGVKKLVELNAIYYGSYNDEKSGNTVAGFQVVGIIKRLDFNVGSKYPNAVLSDDIHINANLEFIKKNRSILLNQK